jgi:hypothetical protein
MRTGTPSIVVSSIYKNKLFIEILKKMAQNTFMFVFICGDFNVFDIFPPFCRIYHVGTKSNVSDSKLYIKPKIEDINEKEIQYLQ